jgi:hypothetical protein
MNMCELVEYLFLALHHHLDSFIISQTHNTTCLDAVERHNVTRRHTQRGNEFRFAIVGRLGSAIYKIIIFAFSDECAHYTIL